MATEITITLTVTNTKNLTHGIQPCRPFFHLSGELTEPESTCKADRPDVTSPLCLCNNTELSWCSQHLPYTKKTNTQCLALLSHLTHYPPRSATRLSSSHHMFELVDIWPQPTLKSHFRGGSAFLRSVSACERGIFLLYFYLKGKTKDVSWLLDISREVVGIGYISDPCLGFLYSAAYRYHPDSNCCTFNQHTTLWNYYSNHYHMNNKAGIRWSLAWWCLVSLQMGAAGL